MNLLRVIMVVGMLCTFCGMVRVDAAVMRLSYGFEDTSTPSKNTGVDGATYNGALGAQASVVNIGRIAAGTDKYSAGYILTGTGAYSVLMTVPDDANLRGQPLKDAGGMTVSFWLNPGAIGNPTYQRAIVTNTAVNIATTYNDVSRVTVYATASDGTTQNLNPIPGYLIANEWHHYAIVIPHGIQSLVTTTKFYRDGQFICNTQTGNLGWTAARIPRDTARVFDILGGNSNANGAWSPQGDGFQIYAGVITDADVQALYAQQFRKVFAHYMVAMGVYGYNVNAFKRDIQDAQAMGIDGFALNCGAWSTATYYQTRTSEMFRAAEELGTDFKLFFSADMATGLDYPDIVNMMQTYASHPNYLSYQGRPVLSTFGGQAQGGGGTGARDWWRNNVLTALQSSGINVWFEPFFYDRYSDEAGSITYDRIKADNDLWWKDVANGLFFFGAAGTPATLSAAQEAYARLMKENYAVHMSSTSPQYWGCTQPGGRRYFEFTGGQGVSTQWDSIIQTQQPQWIEMTTWNDWTEASYYSPVADVGSYLSQYASGFFKSHRGLSELTRYYINWYKTGTQPPINEEMLVYAYRTHPKNATCSDPSGPVTSFIGTVTDTIYVTTMLKSAAELHVITGGVTNTYQVAAGIVHTQVSFNTGTQSFELWRNGQCILQKQGEPINATITKYNFTYATDYAYVGASIGTGAGLTADYYDGATPVTRRIDANVDFAWGNAVPSGTDISSPTNYAVHWNGQLQPKYDDTYTFTVRCDGSFQLWVDGQQIINKSQTSTPTESSSTAITLRAGYKYGLQAVYGNPTSNAQVRLSWSGTLQPKEVIPQRQLYALADNPRLEYTFEEQGTAGKNTGVDGTTYDGTLGAQASIQNIGRVTVGSNPYDLVHVVSGTSATSALLSVPDDTNLRGQPVKDAGGLTVSFWMNPGAIGNPTYQRYLLTSSSLSIITCYNDVSKLTVYAMASDSTTQNLNSTTGYLVPNEWHYYTIVVPQGTQAAVSTTKFYRDGVFVCNTQTGGLGWTADRLPKDVSQSINLFSGNTNSNGAWSPKADAFRLIAGVMNDQDVASLFGSYAPVTGTPMAYAFEDYDTLGRNTGVDGTTYNGTLGAQATVQNVGQVTVRGNSYTRNHVLTGSGATSVLMTAPDHPNLRGQAVKDAGGLTLSFWLNPGTINNPTYQRAILTNAVVNVMTTYNDPTCVTVYAASSDGTVQNLSPTTGYLIPNEWHFYTMVVPAGSQSLVTTTKFYRDGLYICDTQTGNQGWFADRTPATTARALDVLGGNSNPNGAWSPQGDLFSIHAGVMLDAEVLSLMNR